MLLRDLDLLTRDPMQFVLVTGVAMLALLLSVTVHEFSHAAVALTLGDDTAKRLGRVSLNPIRHLDPMGTIMMLLVGFGWGKPVPFNPGRFQRNPLLSSALVAFAGPGSNLVTALAISLPLGYVLTNGGPDLAERFFFTMLMFSLGLGFFNLLPIFPLDGFNVVRGLLPGKIGDQFAQMAAWGPAILFGLVGLGLFTDFSPLSYILSPMINGAARFLLSLSVF